MIPTLLPQVVFFGTVAFSFLAWGIVAARILWPHLRLKSRRDALRPLLILHSFRFIGAGFLVPGVVSAGLPLAFARPAAYGDLIAALLALAALWMLPGRGGTVWVWLFNLWGTADLLWAFINGHRSGLSPGELGAMYFVPTRATCKAVAVIVQCGP